MIEPNDHFDIADKMLSSRTVVPMTTPDTIDHDPDDAITRALMTPPAVADPPDSDATKARDRERSFAMAGPVLWKGRRLATYSALRHWYFAEMVSRMKTRSSTGDGFLVFFILSHPPDYLERVLAGTLSALQLRRLVMRTVDAKMETNGDVHELDRLGGRVLLEVFDARARPADDLDGDGHNGDDGNTLGNAHGQPG